MSFHFVSHPWHVQEMKDGILVKVSAQDLDESTIAILVDELFDLSMAEGRSTVFLDFEKVRLLPHNLIGQLVALEEKLRRVGGRLILQNLEPSVVKILRTTAAAELMCEVATAAE